MSERRTMNQKTRAVHEIRGPGGYTKCGLHYGGLDQWYETEEPLTCRGCKSPNNEKSSDVDLSLTEMVAGDEPDGVFFAIAYELGEVW